MNRRSRSCYLQIGNPHCRDHSEHHEEHASDHGAGYAGKHRPDFPEDAAQEHGAGAGNDHRSTPYLGQEEEEAVAHEPARRGRGRRAPAPACRQGLRLWPKRSMARSATGSGAAAGELGRWRCVGSISICTLVNIDHERRSESNHGSTPIYLVLSSLLLPSGL